MSVATATRPQANIKAGEMRSDVASWISRPNMRAFDNLDDLHAYCGGLAANSFAQNMDLSTVQVGVEDQDLFLDSPVGPLPLNNWSFGQVSREAQAPVNYLRTLPPKLAAVNLQYGLRRHGQNRQAYIYSDDVSTRLRAITSPSYGRITDANVVDRVRQFAGRGDGTDSRWKMPGVMDWSTRVHDPEAKGQPTLCASDRDVFMFLCDDRNPIEVGTLPNGDPDLMFRGFYVWNSEVGSRTFGIATMYLRAVCCNRLLWGVEGFNEVTFQHRVNAPDRFIEQAAPMLTQYAEGAAEKVRQGVQAAKAKAIPHGSTEEAVEFLRKRMELTKTFSLSVLDRCEQEEGKAPETVWDLAQGMTAAARSIPHDDERITVERKAQKLLDSAI